jgi:hypothetical protein
MNKKKKFKDMSLTERKAYWKSLTKEKQDEMMTKIIELIKKKTSVVEPKKHISYQMTDREKRARGGWGNWTSH